MGAEPVSDAETETSHHDARAARRVPRSCQLCHRRKVRCDKKEPCEPCTRAGKPCVFPPAGRGLRRPKKTIMADMATRLASLEKTLAQTSDGAESHRSSPRDAVLESVRSSPYERPATATPCSSVDRRRSGDDILVQKGSSSQYFNEILLTKVIEEEQEIQSVLTTPKSTPAQPLTSSPFNALGILSVPSLSQPASSFHPSKPKALRLWNAYVANVESCTGLKVLHIPTDEVKVYTAIDSPSTASPESLVLCFACYYAAVISLGDVETEIIMAQDRMTVLARFKTGLEQALAQADFLDNPTLTGLQALAIYLSAIRVYNRGKGIWILNGLAIRIAQSLGLHRDGERLGLPPFEAEMRRRLWWHFLGRDCRAGEDYGLENTSNQTRMCDVGVPLNVEDADIYPDMAELPPARKGWTIMTFSLVNVDIAKSMHRLAAIATSSTPSNPPREDVRAQIISELKVRVDERLALCNPVIPRQRITLLIARFIVRKVDLVSRQQWQLLRCPEARESFATEDNLVEALETLELGLMTTSDELLRPYLWSTKAYPQYHMTLYILWHLCVKPEGPSVERAWQAVEASFIGEMGDGISSGLGPKAVVLTALKAKAESIREKIRNANMGADARGSNGDAPPAAKEGAGAPLIYPHGVVSVGDGMDFNMDGGCPPWEALIQEFNFDGENFPNIFWQ